MGPKTLSQPCNYRSWFDPHPHKKERKSCWWVAVPDFPWHKQLIFHGSEKPHLFRETTFLPIASPLPLTTSCAHFRSARHLPVLCWIPFFCSISNQPFVKGAAKAHKESSCSLAVANVQLPGQMQLEALPRSGCQCTLRPPCTPNASSPGWLSPYGTSNWIPISIFFNTGVNLMKTHNVFQRFYFSKSIIQRHRGCFKKNEIHLFFKIVYVFCSRGYFSILWFSC